MTPSSNPPLNARLLEQAAEWVARVHEDSASEDDWLALEAWLAASPDHVAAYDRAETMLGDIAHEAPALLARLDGQASDVVDLDARRKARGRPVFLIAAASAAAAVLLFIGLAPSVWPRTEVYETAAGETRLIALEDGTRINLNGASHIEVRMQGRERHVEMAQAEASFDVAHDPSRPFVVDVGADQVRVIGTEFNIRHDAASTVVTVRRGLVEVRPSGGGANTVRLPAGRAYTRTRGDGSVRQVSPDAAFAWSSGRLIYEDALLSTVAADLSRRFRTPVETDAAAGQLRFTGVLVLDEEDKVINRLQGFLPISTHRSPDRIRLTSKADAG